MHKSMVPRQLGQVRNSYFIQSSMTVVAVTLILASLSDNAQEQCVAPLPCSLPPSGGGPDPAAEHNTAAAAADSGGDGETSCVGEREQ